MKPTPRRRSSVSSQRCTSPSLRHIASKPREINARPTPFSIIRSGNRGRRPPENGGNSSRDSRKKNPKKKPTIRNRAAKIKVVSIHRFGNGEQSRARKGKKTPGRAKSTAGISLKIKLGFKRATLESQRAHSFTRYRHEAGVGTEEYTKRRRLNPPCSLGKDGACGLAGGTADRCRRRRNVKPTGPAQPVGYRRRQRRRSTNPVDTSRFLFPSGWEAETDSSSAR